jgi:hypothetical protein
MTGRGKLGVGRGRGRWLLALGALAATLISAPSAGAFAAPYEPNDSVPSAAGPLLLGQTYAAALETAGDRDFFSFYVTSKRSAQVELTAKNLGGGSDTSGLNVAIVDSLDNAIFPFAYALANGKEAAGTTSLGPGKYFVKVSSIEGSSAGISYSLATSGDNGAFGPYSQIAARCASATRSVKRAKRRLTRTQAKLQRATARVQRSLFSNRKVRRAANAAKHRAAARVAAKRRVLKRVRKSRSPWCSIPQ